MAHILTPFLDGLKSGILEPKGNLGDFAHAARLYVDDSFRLGTHWTWLAPDSSRLETRRLQKTLII